MKRLAVGIIALLLAVPAMASTRLLKLAENHYLITHQKHTFYGGQGRAIRSSYAKAASLCVVLDYSWFEVVDTQSHGRTFRSGAASTLEVKFYRDKAEDKEDLLSCEELATEEYKETMANALLRVDH